MIRLKIPYLLWRNTYRKFVASPESVAIGTMERSQHIGGIDWLVRRMRFVSDDGALGRQMNGSSDYFIFGPRGGRGENEIRRLSASLKPKLGQTLIYYQPMKSGWIGVVLCNDRWLAVDQIEFVGPRMLKFLRQPNDQRVDPADHQQKFSRVAGALGKTTYDRFRQSPTAVIGAGRLGSLMAESLIRMGVETLLIVDPDVIEPHNQDATFGNYAVDIGNSKSHALARHLHRIRPESYLRAIRGRLWQRKVIDQIRGCDVIVSCVDDFAAREQASQLAQQLLLVHLDIGTLVTETNHSAGPATDTGDHAIELLADVRLLLPNSCIHCVNVDGTGQIETGAANLENAAHEPSRPAAEIENWQTGGRVGSLLSLNHLAVGTALQLWTDLLAGNLGASYWQRLRWRSGSELETSGSVVVGDAGCSYCHDGLS